jgi:hypothetical protein
LPFLFLVKDIVLLAASVYLLKQAILRAASDTRIPGHRPAGGDAMKSVSRVTVLPNFQCNF